MPVIRFRPVIVNTPHLIPAVVPHTRAGPDWSIIWKALIRRQELLAGRDAIRGNNSYLFNSFSFFARDRILISKGLLTLRKKNILLGRYC